MARSIWKGEISFGLVSIPISLISTEENNEIHFHLLNSKTNSRVRYQRVDEETGKEVPWDDIVKGYEYDKGNYIIVNDEAFEKASPELFKTIDIEEFVDLKEIDSLYYTKPYYLVPEGKNKKAYVLLREALKKTNKVGVAKTILRTKEYLSLILPHEHALLLYLIHFKDELRSEEEINVPREDLKTYKISDKEIKMAVDLIQDMSAKWDPEKYHNEYHETLQKWLDNQVKALTQKGKKVTKAVRSHEGVIDFVTLLKESMKKKKPLPTPKSKSQTKK
ncbi:Ku protein [Fluoribacter dumoffii]|uniref:Non-homologous end joining protein Ku n=1 Tax=Fluoribacter dumoffii TaxID=463 RepID=A0A377G8L4_9GAMM|nr:Ku protein [Fluoribacter dumoffii]KTC89853.1 putative DNA repair protein YkoV [Fluoribacter dumoffii NY 23]MCW8418205.1 Ku protein [Fluoribacter dumoffii]MCW8453953.1 Ku protein [Fluoribacter dumoffii]MCW8461976.1 Ku protein [Fluoribacter dumoffii]MCW8482188.1 Ku protein [Fluoribacter dumoffii]